MQVNKLPTGYLFVEEYSKGKLETLSIGDYGESRYEWFLDANYHGHKIQIPVGSIQNYVIGLSGTRKEK